MTLVNKIRLLVTGDIQGQNRNDAQDLVVLKVSQSASEWNAAAIVNASNKKLISTKKKSFVCFPNAQTVKPKVRIKQMSTNEWNTLALSREIKTPK